MTKFLTYVVTLVLLSIFGAVFALLNGWSLMLLAGVLHGSVWALVPALGYWPSVVVAYSIMFVGGLFNFNSNVFSSNK